MVQIDIGWLMIISGILLLLIEVSQPGFFAAVPGTTLIVLGVVILLIPEQADDWAPLIIVVVALISSIITVLLYHKLAPPNRKPQTVSQDILIGKEGIVTSKIIPDSISGKVKINNQIWSATSDDIIEVGRKVVIINSEGVHVKVKEV